MYNEYKNKLKELELREWTKKELLDGEVKIDNKFVWLNRTDEEIKRKGSDLFKPNGWTVMGQNNEVVANVQLSVVNKKGELEPTNWKVAVGKFEAINNSSKMRGGESYSSYKYIIWDEFMDESNKYIKDEMWKVDSILTTVMRDKTGTKLIWLSNTVSKDNEVFRKFKFNADWIKKDEQLLMPDRKIVFCYVGANEKLKTQYEESDLQTILGKDSEYLKYRFGGDFTNDSDELILRELDPRIPLKPAYNILYLGNLIGVFDYKGKTYFDGDRIIDGAKVYPLSSVDAVSIGKEFTNIDNLANQYFNKLKRGTILFNNSLTQEVVEIFISKNGKINTVKNKIQKVK